jgi:flagellar motor switch protein FliM
VADELLNQPTVPPASPRPYDFRAKGSVSLDELHAAFAGELSAALSEHLRGGVEIGFSFAEQIRYDDFLYSLGEVSCLSVLRIDPPGAEGLLDLSLPVIYPMIDRLLGGHADAATPVPRRPLTQIERGLALQIVERTAGRLADTWGRIAPIVVREQSVESTPADVRIMPGEEIVQVARFEVRMTGGGGTMSLCIPEPVAQYLREIPPPPLSYAERDAAKANIQSNLVDAAVELRALLAETKLRLSDVLSLQVGDVITTEKGAQDEVPVQVEGSEKYHGRLGQLRGTRAVQITRGPHAPDLKDSKDLKPPEGGS